MLSQLPGLDGEDIVALTGGTVFDPGLTQFLDSVRNLLKKKYAGRDKSVSLASGPCSMFRADMLRSIGGFSPDWFHAEDMEVSLTRMIQNGGTILYVPEATVSMWLRRGLQFLRRDIGMLVHILE